MTRSNETGGRPAAAGFIGRRWDSNIEVAPQGFRSRWPLRFARPAANSAEPDTTVAL